MEYYAGIDVSLEDSSVCVVDGAGKIVKEAKVAVRAVLLRELNGFEKQVRKQAKSDARVRLTMTAPGVAPSLG